MTAMTVWRDRLEDRFSIAAALIVLTIIMFPIGGDHRVGQFLLVFTEGVTMVVIMHAARVRARVRRIVVLSMLGAMVASAFALSLDRETIGAAVVGGLLACLGPIIIIRRVRTHARIDMQTIAASLCVYLLGGLFFAYTYRVMGGIDEPFFVQAREPIAADFVYFSFTTLTTLGYGDLTARTSPGRMVAVAEALIGQLYLVSVVALLVGNIGQARRVRGVASDADASDEEHDR